MGKSLFVSLHTTSLQVNWLQFYAQTQCTLCPYGKRVLCTPFRETAGSIHARLKCLTCPVAEMPRTHYAEAKVEMETQRPSKLKLSKFCQDFWSFFSHHLYAQSVI